jgi:sulfur carrier protein
MSISKKPVVFIGGINLGNIDIVLREGAKNISSITGITQADDITSRVKEFRRRIDASLKRPKIPVRVNGKKEEIDAKCALVEFIEKRNLHPDKIVVERNFEIVPKEKWHEVVIEAEDSIEIISFVGGG